MRRPPLEVPSDVEPSFWDIYGWQVQTYAHLSAHEDSLPVIAGAIIYLNELRPTAGDLISLRKEIRAGTTDIAPPPGSEAAKILNDWDGEENPSNLAARLSAQACTARSRGHPGNHTTPLQEFDDVVARVETCRGRELVEEQVISAGRRTPCTRAPAPFATSEPSVRTTEKHMPESTTKASLNCPASAHRFELHDLR